MSKKQPPKPPKPKKPNKHDLDRELHANMIRSAYAPFNVKESIDDYIVQSGVILCEAARVAIQRKKSAADRLREFEGKAAEIAAPIYRVARHLRKHRILPKGVNPFKDTGTRRRKKISKLERSIAKHRARSQQLLHHYYNRYSNIVGSNHSDEKKTRKFARQVDRDLRHVQRRKAKLGRMQSKLRSLKTTSTSGHLAKKYHRVGNALKSAAASALALPGTGYVTGAIGGALAGPKGAAAGFGAGAAVDTGAAALAAAHGAKTSTAARKLASRQNRT